MLLLVLLVVVVNSSLEMVVPEYFITLDLPQTQPKPKDIINVVMPSVLHMPLLSQPVLKFLMPNLPL